MKLSYNEALEAIANERHISAADVQARALRRKVWVMMFSAPGCLPDNRNCCATRADALECARANCMPTIRRAAS